MAPTLRFVHHAAGDVHTVEVHYVGDYAAPVLTSTFRLAASPEDRESIRWYLEDFLEYPLPPADSMALRVEERLRTLGTELFQGVFGGDHGRRLWTEMARRLPETRVEIAAEGADIGGVPWELLRDPRTDRTIALEARSFVHLQKTQDVRYPPHPSEDGPLRVLLVISRPHGAYDVPFRSIAGQLVGLGEAMPDAVQVDVLRPPTFASLGAVLRAALDSGQPYHIVHFDGHGAYGDPSSGEWSSTGDAGRAVPLSPVRSGPHGYLLFEGPQGSGSQLVDGPALGQLLTTTQVPVLVLNACRSAYAEARTGPQPDDERSSEVDARVQAYGSLAQEVTDAGVPGVVAMRYNVYVVTAAQFVADLYLALLAGRDLGDAVAAGRRQLASQPERRIAFAPVPLQDWCVPVVYEAVPLTLFRPSDRPDVRVRLPLPIGDADGSDALPHRPYVGFFGRDETLLALDRAFDRASIVLLHAYAGAGKTTTAVEFARWYGATGGIDAALAGGTILFSSFEQHLPLSRLLNQLGTVFAPLLEANGIQWLALDEITRRRVALQLLRQVPVLWIWDNVDPVAGYPGGTASAWSPAEQDELRDFLRDLLETRARVLLTARGDERDWLGDLPERLSLPPMPMRERIQLTQALAERQAHRITDVQDWRPLLRYTAGNPLSIMVLVGAALREGLRTREEIELFVERLKAGEADLVDDDREGRSASLSASLGYGFTHAFDEVARRQLAVLHLFRETVSVVHLTFMGDPDAGSGVPELAGMRLADGESLLERAAEIGLLAPLGAGFYAIHPALPWYFARLFTNAYGAAEQPVARRVRQAYTAAVAALSNYLLDRYETGERGVLAVLTAHEANMLNAHRWAAQDGRWPDVLGCMQGLRVLYGYAGRLADWQALVRELEPELVDPATDGPRPDRAEFWSLFTDYRVRLAREARDWQTATRLQQAIVAVERERLAAVPAADTDPEVWRPLSVALEQLGHIRREARRPECVELYQEAYELCLRAGDRVGQATVAFNLGHAFKNLPELRDLDQAERWYRQSLDLRPEDQLGRARTLGQLGAVAYERFQEGRRADRPEPELTAHLQEAQRLYSTTIDALPPEAAGELPVAQSQLGAVLDSAGRYDEALTHYRAAIRHWDAVGDRYQAGLTRRNVALALARSGRLDDSVLYAAAAVRDLDAFGGAAASEADEARRLLDDLRLQQAGQPG